MSKYVLKFLFLLLVVYSSANVQANNSVFNDVVNASIEVSGSGSITAIPDDFSLSLTITERGRVTSKLKTLVDKKSNLVIQVAKKVGLKKKDINSAQVNLRVIEEKPAIVVQDLAFKNNGGREIGKQIKQKSNNKTLFELSRRIQVHFNNIDDYDRFLAQLVKINVSYISSLAMDVTQRDQYYQQALLQAITQAKNKAQKMLQHTGERLGKLIYLKEQSTNYYQPRYAKAMMSESSSNNHTSLVGSQTIKASVLMKFALAKQ